MVTASRAFPIAGIAEMLDLCHQASLLGNMTADAGRKTEVCKHLSISFRYPNNLESGYLTARVTSVDVSP